MPESVSLDWENGIIVIESSGAVEIDDLLQSLEAVLDIARSKGLNKVLADVTALTALPSISNLYNFAYQLSKKANCLKHAVVISEHSPVEITFVETVAINRGTNIHVFTSRDKALTWLKM